MAKGGNLDRENFERFENFQREDSIIRKVLTFLGFP